MKTTVTISKPCSQNWDTMQAVTNGKFCNHCQKTVTDFTTLSDTEINRLIKNANGNLCGRFLQSQVNRPLQVNKTKHMPFGKFFLSLSLATIFNNTLQAFTKLTPAYYQHEPQKINNFNLLGDDSLRVITIKVIDKKTKETVPFANVVLYSGKEMILAATTTVDGVAQLKIPVNYTGNVFNVKVVYVGYQPTMIMDIDISKTNYIEFNMVGGIELTMVGALEVVKPNLWQRIKNIFKHKN